MSSDSHLQAMLDAVTNNEEDKLNKILLSSQYSLNACDSKGMTACMWAAEYGHLECLTILKKFGANLDLVDHDGCSSLMLATRWGRYECLKFFLKNKCDPSKHDKDGRTPLMIAARFGYKECLQVLVESCKTRNITGATTDSLLSYINTVDTDGNSALLLALEFDEMDCADYLLNSDADVNIVNSKGQTALFFSFYYQDFSLIKRILNAGAKPCQSPNDQGFIHEAISLGKDCIVRHMILNGCFPTLKICKGSSFKFKYVRRPISPLTVAILCDNYDLVQYFIEIRYFISCDIKNIFQGNELIRNFPREKFVQALTSLKTLSFVAMSSFAGAYSNRTKNLKSIRLPASIEKDLLFKGTAAHLCVSQWQHLFTSSCDLRTKPCDCPDCDGTKGIRFDIDI